MNDREDKLLEEINNLYNAKYFNEDIIKKGDKLPKKIKLSLEKGKLIDKEWDNINLYSYINDCIKLFILNLLIFLLIILISLILFSILIQSLI